MEQYYAMKAKHPDAILLYRVGDFYETFAADAIQTSNVLGIVLTKRNNGGNDIELAGFPYHSLDAYLPKLVRAGFRVAICEQLEKPSKGKKVVKRGITDVITPGVTTDDKLLDHRKNNFLAAVNFSPQVIGISFVDISTGEFYVSEGSEQYINKLLQSFRPSEIVIKKSSKALFEKCFGESYYTYCLEDWIFTDEFTREKLLKHFKVLNLKGFGVEDLIVSQVAAGSILYYLETTENHNPTHISQISKIASEEYVWMDRFTIRNLELIDSLHPEGSSLIQILDQCKTPMGSRLLRRWMILPLLKINKIQERLNAVDSLVTQSELLDDLRDRLHLFGDMERLVSKIPLLRISPREVLHIKNNLLKLKPIKEILAKHSDPLLQCLSSKINGCEALEEQISKQIKDDAPNQIIKSGVIQDGFSKELDELRYIVTNGKDLLLDIQKEEALKTGITNLKIGFNSVFGYFLEVTNKYKNQGLIPDHWVRKQTMSTGERYITDELKKLETKILGAEERIIQLEEEIFNQLIQFMQDYVLPLQQNAHALAELDCITSFAHTAQKNNYTKPNFNDNHVIHIKSARHPVIEKQLPVGESYIPNDIYLDNDAYQILMITGPNMSGKSAILRQTALICLMAQIGSFIPAESAELSIIDRIFTRVGASDNISSGESTFMVEMNETASILNNLSDRSIVLMDEIGRGTSTYDGISIAWSIAEFLHEQTHQKAKTLFATHYHELNELALQYNGIKNFHVSTQEINNKVIFLRKLVAGGSEHSFGIHVAEMAGMPSSIVNRANEILHDLESSRASGKIADSNSENMIPKPNLQIKLAEALPEQERKVYEEIRNMDINTLSPIECMMKIAEWRKKLNL